MYRSQSGKEALELSSGAKKAGELFTRACKSDAEALYRLARSVYRGKYSFSKTDFYALSLQYPGKSKQQQATRLAFVAAQLGNVKAINQLGNFLEDTYCSRLSDTEFAALAAVYPSLSESGYSDKRDKQTRKLYLVAAERGSSSALNCLAIFIQKNGKHKLSRDEFVRFSEKFSQLPRNYINSQPQQVGTLFFAAAAEGHEISLGNLGLHMGRGFCNPLTPDKFEVLASKYPKLNELGYSDARSQQVKALFFVGAQRGDYRALRNLGCSITHEDLHELSSKEFNGLAEVYPSLRKIDYNENRACQKVALCLAAANKGDTCAISDLERLINWHSEINARIGDVIIPWLIKMSVKEISPHLLKAFRRAVIKHRLCDVIVANIGEFSLKELLDIGNAMGAIINHDRRSGTLKVAETKSSKRIAASRWGLFSSGPSQGDGGEGGSRDAEIAANNREMKEMPAATNGMGLTGG